MDKPQPREAQPNAAATAGDARPHARGRFALRRAEARAGHAAEDAESLRRTRAVGLSRHPDEHGPQRPVFLAVDQELREGAGLRVASELADRVGAVEVGQH
jgi:hypothetical protein